METLAELRARGIKPDPEWAKKHGLSEPEPPTPPVSAIPYDTLTGQDWQRNWSIDETHSRQIEDLINRF